MNRPDAIQAILSRHPDAAVIFCNGLNSREASFASKRPGNFYLLHAMGEALSVGIGLRLACPDLDVVIVDGDGNAVMGLAALTLLPIEGLHYYVLVNDTYETTGSQSTPALSIEHPAMKRISIEAGTIGAPLPPKPEQIKNNFMTWLASREQTRM